MHPVGETLRAATEKLNALLKEAEAAICASQEHVEVQVKLPSGPLLKYGKWNGLWGLYVCFSDGHTVPLSNVSRALRVEAALALHDLVAKIPEALANETERTLAAVEKMEEFMSRAERPAGGEK